MGANERRAEIIKILQGRREEKRKNLASQLGVSERTIRYDVQMLMAEYPIETVRGNGGGIRLVENYGQYKGAITEDQQNALIAAISLVDVKIAKYFGEILRAHGSFRKRSEIEEAIKKIL